MIENWASKGMPPEEYDVLGKLYRFHPDGDSYSAFFWIRGAHPHKGTVITDGWQGVETVVEFNYYPGLKPRIIKNQQDVEKTHPLHKTIEQRRNNHMHAFTIFEG